MDIRALLTFVANHVEQIFGVTLILFFVTSLLLLIRSIGQKSEVEVATSGHGSIDPQSVEDAVRRALGSTPNQIAIAAPTGDVAPVEVAEGDPAALEKYKQEVQKRDARIEELSKEIAALREKITSATAAPNEASAPGAAISDAELKELWAKLDDMQGRLSEYEIIEDDIADLSLFKEENARLKAELDDLKSRLGGSSAAAPTPTTEESAFGRAGASSAEASPEATSAPTDSTSEPAAQAAAPAPDDVMREFAAAVDSQRAPPAAAASSIPFDAEAVASMTSAAEADPSKAEDPQAAIDAMMAEAESQVETVAAVTNTEETTAAPANDPLNESPDPDKMLAEVASLLAEDSNGPNALEESLDTDRLLAEVGELEAAPQTSEIASDDLLAEFAGEATSKTPKG